MTERTPTEQALSTLLIEALNLEDAGITEIEPEAPLFGPQSPLGLDSVDALEIAMAISTHYGFEMKSDDENNEQIFASLRALNQHVEANRTQ